MPFLTQRRALHVLLIVILVAAVGCAHQPEPSVSLSPGDLELGGQLAGFVVGLFHGFTMAFNMIASLFFDVRIYAFPNSGRLYDLGYVLGAMAVLGGSGGASRASRGQKTSGPSSQASNLAPPSATCPSCGHTWVIRRPETPLPL